MIISKIISGLGNQLFQYAIGRQLSLKNHTSLKLDLSFFQHSGDAYAFDQLTRSFKLNHYNIEAEIASEKEVHQLTGAAKNNGLYGKIYRKLITLQPRNHRSYFTEQHGWLYDADLLKAGPNTYIEGYWQHHRYFQHLSPQILQELTLKEDYQNTYKSAITVNNASVSLHIRRGDYINDGLFAVQPITYYHSAVELICAKIKDPTFFIFSDDLDWVRDNLQLHGETTFVEGQPDYIDLDLMSRCQHNIIANSSFSWWGAMLNKNKDKIVIAPSQWLKQVDLNQRIALAFPGWIVI